MPTAAPVVPRPRKIRDHEDAAACLAAVTASGLPLRAWCHAEGVNARSLHMWKIVRARTTAPRSAELRLVEILTAGSPGEPLRVHVRDVAVEVPPTFDESALRRLIGVLRQC